MAEGCNLKCGICKSCFIEPKLLDCYHTFCSPCLQKLDVRDSKIVCPLCKTNIPLPDNGVSGLKPYPFKLGYVTEPNAIMDACELCYEQNIAMATCLECKISLCSNCRNYHGKLKASRNHTIEPLQQNKSENVDQSGENDKDKCKDHGKEFSFFCKPCYCLLCIECSEEYHRCHQVENLSVLLQSKKEKLLVRIASFKARISFLQNTADMVRLKESNYDKHCLVLKQDVKEHAKYLKDRFCSTVDELTNKNLDTIDNIKTKDINELDKYLIEIETAKMSLSGLVMITEDFINKLSVAHFREEFSHIGKRLDNELCKSVSTFPSIHDLNFERKDVAKDIIENIFGKVTARAKKNETKQTYPQLPLPELGLLSVHKAGKISEFVLETDIKDIVPAENDYAWILSNNEISMFSYKGICISEGRNENSNMLPNAKRIVRKSANEIRPWYGCLKRENTKYNKSTEDPFTNELFCCVVRNGNLLVYNDRDAKFYELTDQESVQNKIEIDNFFQQMHKYRYSYKVKAVAMKQTKNLNFVISFCEDVVLFTDKHFKVLDTFWKYGAQFKAIATDNYGNVFLADSKHGFVYMLSENGVFLQNLLSENEGISNTTDMIVDECGHLWLVGSSKSVQVFSYQ
ncbi:tripartite motif-containing protein 2/3 [Mytilus galloprovincialis]|uniref:Tripartite motif-containing protein 2/3 n=1 Tax=Mytilus galloprovincialis TaxID=29158 RepID=A0A8B6FMC6_MYTGA|nr:tripartite motif-containing protein 2/3 [Mytilus galloprovincialis]